MLAASLVSCLLSPAIADAAKVEQVNGLTVAYLSGTPYELGRQHGELLRDRVQASVRQVLGYFRRYIKVPVAGTLLVDWWLGRTWSQSRRHIPPDYLDELRGLAHGAGVPFDELCRLHAIPDRTYSCTNFSAWGEATGQGRLVHGRNLDWNIDARLQDYAVVFVVRPNGKQAFVNVAWAGFTGVLTGINERGLSIGQVGAESKDVTFRGEPMVFLMRRVMEEPEDLDEAVRIIETAKRTMGINYVIADAKAGRAVAIETTRSYAKVFRDEDPAEQAVAYAKPLRHAVVRADTAMDPLVRDRQLASKGDPTRPGLEDPSGSSAYDVRYVKTAGGITGKFGALDAEAAKEIMRSVAPSSNVQSVVFAWPELWVANAEGLVRAAESGYHRLDLDALFKTSAAEATRR